MVRKYASTRDARRADVTILCLVIYQHTHTHTHMMIELGRAGNEIFYSVVEAIILLRLSDDAKYRQ